MLSKHLTATSFLSYFPVESEYGWHVSIQLVYAQVLCCNQWYKAITQQHRLFTVILAIEFIYAILYSLSIQWDAWRKKVKLFKNATVPRQVWDITTKPHQLSLSVQDFLESDAQLSFKMVSPLGIAAGSLGPERHPSAHTKGLFGSCSPMHHGARPRGPATRDCLKNWFVLAKSQRLVLCKMFDLHLSPTKCQRRLP